MIKRLLLIVTLGVCLSGCFMAPLALIGPATSGYQYCINNTGGVKYWSKLYGEKKYW